MPISVTRLTPRFAAWIDGADIRGPLDQATWAAIPAAFEEHSVLLLRGAALDEQRTTIAGDPAESAAR